MFGRRLRNRQRLDERGVSPVIGTVLILVIMIFSIGGILAWGVPAIEGLQDRAEFQTMLTQFLQMDSQVRNLRDPQNTRVITLAVSEGQLSFTKGERWVITGARKSAADTVDYDAFYLDNWEGSNPQTVTIQGIATSGLEITVDVVRGGSFVTRYSCSATCPATLPLGTNPNVPNLDNDVVRITIKSGSNVKAESWIMNMGRISYHQSDTNELNRLHFSMGAVFSQQNQAFFLEETPTLKDPDFVISPKDTNLFVRALQLNGTATTASGEGRRPIIFNLVDNYGASRGRPSFDPASSVRLQINGVLEIPFCNFFDARPNWRNENAGAVANCPTSGTGGNVNLRFVRPNSAVAPPTVGTPESMAYDLSHAVVTTTVRQL